MVRVLIVAVAVTALVAGAPGGAAVAAGPPPSRLPPAVLSDQEGRVLDLESLRGRTAVIVYGDRGGLTHHVAWGRRLDAELRQLGVYREGDAEDARPVRILAVAQMGGIPGPFREMLRALIRPRVEAGYSLWLDWESLLSATFGQRAAESTVVLVDPSGAVRLVVGGRPEGAPYRTVSEALRGLR